MKKSIDFLKLYRFVLLVAVFLSLGCLAHIEVISTPQWHLPDGAKTRIGKGRITGSISFSPDSTKLAVASSIGIWIYDAQTGQELDLYTDHTGEVTSVVFSPDGNTIASGSSAATLRLCNANNGTHLRTLSGHTHRVRIVAFSPDGNTTASVSLDGTVLLWNVTSDGSLDVEPDEKQWTTWGQIKTTRVLQNYPNPFNPETWIPYQLATPADVSISIYAADGTLVRTLDLGHQPVGIYQHRNNAAHWDGKNADGEPVASVVYFHVVCWQILCYAQDIDTEVNCYM